MGTTYNFGLFVRAAIPRLDKGQDGEAIVKQAIKMHSLPRQTSQSQFFGFQRMPVKECTLPQISTLNQPEIVTILYYFSSFKDTPWIKNRFTIKRNLPSCPFAVTLPPLHLAMSAAQEAHMCPPVPRGASPRDCGEESLPAGFIQMPGFQPIASPALTW